MTRVLHVAAYYAPAFVYGGPPRSIHALCLALRERGVAVQVATTDADGAGTLPPASAARTEYEGVPVRYFPRSWPPSPIGSAGLAAALRRDVSQYDVVHIHGLWNRVVWSAARAARRAGVPYVLSPRGMLEPAALAHRAWRKRAAWALVERRVVEGASLLHATSETERDTLLALGVAAPVAVIPNGVRLEPLAAADGPRPPTVLFLGRLHPIKRLDLLVEAFAALHERRPDARLVIAGPDEAGLRPSLTARAGRHAGAIAWTGAVDDAQRRALLQQASALVQCSDSESFGMSVLEALAAAVPVVVTRGCPWRAIEQHGAGYWVEQRAAAVAEALERILADPDEARAMGGRGRALAESTYAWGAIAAACAAQYERLRAMPAGVPALDAAS